MRDKFVSRSPDTAARMLGGEMMIMSVRNSTLFTLDEVGSVIWNAADGTLLLREIVAREIVPRFEVDAEVAYRDALEFVEQLAEHGILRVSEEPTGPERR
jgi:Coenzyme PQQ synthesis protein D (PqqD)